MRRSMKLWRNQEKCHRKLWGHDQAVRGIVAVSDSQTPTSRGFTTEGLQHRLQPSAGSPDRAKRLLRLVALASLSHEVAEEPNLEHARLARTDGTFCSDRRRRRSPRRDCAGDIISLVE